MYRRLQLCSGHGGYEALPETAVVLDLARAKAALENEGVPVIDARVMLIASFSPEVTISRAGRLLFKTQDASEAERAFERLRALLSLHPMVQGETESTPVAE